jgi:hypothetical protein
MSLAEGSSGGPFWHIDSVLLEQQQFLPIVDLDEDRIVDSILLGLAAVLGTEDLKWLLREHENCLENQETLFAPFWDLDDGLRSRILDEIGETLKIGVVHLEPVSLVSQGVIRKLESFGIDVGVFN